MTHKIILIIASLVLSTIGLSMQESPLITQENYKEEPAYEWVTTALHECKKRIVNIQNALEFNNKKFDSYDSDLDYSNQKIGELEEKIKEAQKNIHFLQNSTKNNNLQINTLEQSINLITDKMQTVTKDIETLKSNEKHYASKKDMTFLREEEKQSPPTIAYKQYAVKIVPIATVIGILYILRNPIQMRLYAGLKRMKLFFARKNRVKRPYFSKGHCAKPIS